MRTIHPKHPVSSEAARKFEHIGSRSRPGVAFPLTPALSLRERENPRQRVGESGAPSIFERRAAGLPLPKGESRGEGEQGPLVTNSLDLTNCLCHCTVLLATLCSVAALCGCGPSVSEAPPKTAAPLSVQTVLPRRGEIARSITLPSFRILAYQEATLYAKVSGYLKTLTVDKGDAV